MKEVITVAVRSEMLRRKIQMLRKYLSLVLVSSQPGLKRQTVIEMNCRSLIGNTLKSSRRNCCQTGQINYIPQMKFSHYTPEPSRYASCYINRHKFTSYIPSVSACQVLSIGKKICKNQRRKEFQENRKNRGV